MGLNILSRKKTHEEFAKEVYNLEGENYDVISKYINSYTKILMRHNSCGTEYEVIPSNFLKGSRCPECYGTKKKTTIEFKKEVYNLVGDEYKVIDNYINAKTKLTMKHEICGNEYKVKPNLFLTGIRCPICNGLKKTHNQFLKEVKCLVGEEYKILEDYQGTNTDIKIKHNVCGSEYITTPTRFLGGKRCPKCFPYVVYNKKTTDKFKSEVYDLVGGEYEVIGEYTNSKTKVSIKHNRCGKVINILPNNFLRGNRCIYCSGKKKKTTEEFKDGVYKVYGDEYEVVGDYINNKTEVNVKHKKCSKSYKILPKFLLSGGHVCRFCGSSKGEINIQNILDNIELNYSKELRINYNKRTLRVDFVILDKNDKIILGIEYDGLQHFEPRDFFGGEEGFKETLKRDKLKDEWFKENNIPLLRIPYWNYDNIEDILKVKLLDLGLIEK